MKKISMICWLASGVVAIATIAGCIAQQPKAPDSPTLFDPPMNQQQKIEVQKKIDAQLLLKSGGQQISSTQVAYDNANAVITFPVPGQANTPNTTCDFGYVCFWEHIRYVGKKLALRSTPATRTENLAQYDMSNKISSWKHNNNFFYVAIAGASQLNLGGIMVMANTFEFDIGSECCPFGIEQSTQHAPPPEFVFNEQMGYDNQMVSVGFYPYPQRKTAWFTGLNSLW